MSRRKFMPKLLVVKFGTDNLSSYLSNVRDEGGKMKRSLDPQIFSDYARQIVELYRRRTKIIIVTSGAIRAGEERVERLARRASDFAKKELAAIGTRHLLNQWGEAFENEGIEIAPIWVTFQNWNDEGERESIKSSILNLLRQGVIPVVNENDVVSDWEIKWMEKGISENDRLTKAISFLIGADAVLFLTNGEGVYEDNPETNSQARLYDEVSMWGDLKRLINSSAGISEGGSGGMRVKLETAVSCAKKGMEVAIAGREIDAIVKFAKGESVGTRIGQTTKFRVC